jgi:hypothetical protein
MVTVSPIGVRGANGQPPAPAPNNGADFGPDTPGTASQGVVEALASLGHAGGGTLVFLRGTFTMPTTAFVPARSILQFDDATIALGTDAPAFRVARGATDVRFTGKLTVDGANRNERFCYVVNSSAFLCDATISVGRIGHPNSAFLVRESKGVKFVGPMTSSDSGLIRLVDSSDVEVANVDCTYVRDPEHVPIGVFGTAPMSGIHLHNIHINGGGLRKKPLLIVAPDLAGPPAQNIMIEDVVLENPPTTTEFHDGLDVTHCVDVVIDRVTGSWLNLVVNVNTARATVRGVKATNCWGPGLQVGDPTYMKENIGQVVVEDCEVHDSGRGYLGLAGSGLGVYCTPGFSVTDVVFRRCISTDTRRVQPIGFAVMKGATQVRVESCQFSGVKGKVWNDAGPGAATFIDTAT